ncbi:1-acyl-sn-glycerol-3-phosphate acyltransferase [Sphingomonas bacterium]|uniref:lysophospholipid acyltransferase family protein n=1 Tax=Sphingomonas bacterium TaxID=1895847 RepID=UPI0015770295|nr:lysophospholipid acyltransferase family protein [Sphingomonas bacterium]
MATLRLWRRAGLLLLALGLALVLHGAWRLVRRPSPWPRWLLGTCARIVGARARIVGTPLARDAVIVSNHLSWIDILLLAGATGTAFVAKAELRGAPLVGWLSTLNHTLFVARDDRLNVAAQIDAMRAAIAQPWPIAIFPEGTTGNGRTLLPFKATLLAALDPPPPGVRVQPVRIDYGDATGDLAWVGDEPGAAHAKRVLQRQGSFTATLRFCAPFDPAAVGGRKAIAGEARARMEAA